MPDDPQFEETSGQNELEPEPPRNLSKGQKQAIAGLAVFAFLIVVFWFIQLKNNIYGPLNAPASSSNLATEADSQTAKDLALKNKDTDADSLSDYDELNVYKTSPYLDDSDSDSFKDGLEVKNNTDPNCPQGRTCGAGADANSAATNASSALPNAGSDNLSPADTLNSLLNQYNAIDSSLGGGSTDAGAAAQNLTSDQIQALQNIDAASLRQLLIQNGMDKATLDKISDTELMQTYSESLNGQ